MPPKKPRGNARRSLRNSNNVPNRDESAEDVKPNIDPPSSEADLPSNPLKPFATPPAPTANTSITPNQPPSTTSTARTPNSFADSTPTTTPGQFTGSISAATTPSHSTIDTSSAPNPDAHHDTPVSAAPASRGRKLLSQPKHPGRRSQARLQELQKAETDKRPTPANSASVKRDVRGRGASNTGRSRGRGRGGYVDGSVRGPSKAVASGPFGAGEASEHAKRQAAQSASRSRTKAATIPKASSSKSASAPTTTVDGKIVKQESGTGQYHDGDVQITDRPIYFVDDGGYVSSDEDEEGEAIKRLNVEDLGVIDLTQDENDFDAFAPVRVARLAHKERAFGINADGATNEDGVITVDANDTAVSTADKKVKYKTEVIEEDRIFQGTYSDSESDSETGVRNARKPERQQPTASNDAIKDPPSSPDISRKGKGKLKARALTAEEEDYYTRDELDEWERQQQDLIILRSTLGGPVSSVVPQEADASTPATDTDKRADNVFLFQFPPTMPDLSSPKIKVEPDMEMSEPNPTSAAEPMTITDDAAASPVDQRQTFPSGFVGKLRVHASGRVSLDWGGTDMCLQMGSHASFLQDVVIANLPEAKEDDEAAGAQTGSAMSMGQVKGKFVVTPDFFA